jgi:hypothetical protein
MGSRGSWWQSIQELRQGTIEYRYSLTAIRSHSSSKSPNIFEMRQDIDTHFQPISAYLRCRYWQREIAFKVHSSENCIKSRPLCKIFPFWTSLNTSDQPATNTIGPRLAVALATLVATVRTDRSLGLPGPSTLADLNIWRISNSNSCAPPSASLLDTPCITRPSINPPWLNMSAKCSTVAIGAWAKTARASPSNSLRYWLSRSRPRALSIAVPIPICVPPICTHRVWLNHLSSVK